MSSWLVWQVAVGQPLSLQELHIVEPLQKLECFPPFEDRVRGCEPGTSHIDSFLLRDWKLTISSYNLQFFIFLKRGDPFL